ncbi:HAD-IIIC family phosphatase [Aquirufa sp. ROCK-SH2]
MNLSFKDLKNNLKKDYSQLSKIKVALLGDSSTQFLAIAIRGLGIEKGFFVDLFEADFNQIEGQIFNPNSELHNFNADFVVVFQSTHKLLSKYNKTPIEKQILLADERINFLTQAANSIQAPIIYFNYPEIDDSVYGSYSNKVESSFSYQIRKLNFELMNAAKLHSNIFICDIASLQNKFGRNLMFSSSIYISADMVLSLDIIPYVASNVMNIILAAQGKFKKCLILDLDNTLWGGIIGDDGLENINIGIGLGIGKAFSEFQQWIKKLKNRGVIIAICSKNNDKTAKEPFEKHPDMILKLEDVAVFVANWNNKADNIRHIQSVLNIGFDSMVFLDDNPFERNLVRDNIQGIVVPELPEDPGEYLEYLYSLNLFETISISTTDADRTKQYQLEAERVSIQALFINESDYLSSLHMVSSNEEINTFNIPRIAQLSQRSNQFNLRTVRYNESDIEKMARSDKFKIMPFTLSDKLGHMGLIAVIILEIINEETLFINTWLMSCRVLKRSMENFTLNSIVKYARDSGFTQIIGEYIATPKNELVKDHYTNLGFKKLDNKNQNLFSLNVLLYQDRECFINVFKN